MGVKPTLLITLFLVALLVHINEAKKRKKIRIHIPKHVHVVHHKHEGYYARNYGYGTYGYRGPNHVDHHGYRHGPKGHHMMESSHSNIHEHYVPYPYPTHQPHHYTTTPRHYHDYHPPHGPHHSDATHMHSTHKPTPAYSGSSEQRDEHATMSGMPHQIPPPPPPPPPPHMPYPYPGMFPMPYAPSYSYGHMPFLPYPPVPMVPPMPGMPGPYPMPYSSQENYHSSEDGAQNNPDRPHDSTRPNSHDDDFDDPPSTRRPHHHDSSEEGSSFYPGMYPHHFEGKRPHIFEGKRPHIPEEESHRPRPHHDSSEDSSSESSGHRPHSAASEHNSVPDNKYNYPPYAYPYPFPYHYPYGYPMRGPYSYHPYPNRPTEDTQKPPLDVTLKPHTYGSEDDNREPPRYHSSGPSSHNPGKHHKPNSGDPYDSSLYSSGSHSSYKPHKGHSHHEASSSSHKPRRPPKKQKSKPSHSSKSEGRPHKHRPHKPYESSSHSHFYINKPDSHVEGTTTTLKPFAPFHHETHAAEASSYHHHTKNSFKPSGFFEENFHQRFKQQQGNHEHEFNKLKMEKDNTKLDHVKHEFMKQDPFLSQDLKRVKYNHESFVEGKRQHEPTQRPFRPTKASAVAQSTSFKTTVHHSPRRPEKQRQREPEQSGSHSNDYEVEGVILKPSKSPPDNTGSYSNKNNRNKRPKGSDPNWPWPKYLWK